jgi:type I restriction enzyme S subunit
VVPDVFEENPLISCDVAAVHSASGFSPFYLEKLFNSDDYHRYLRPFAAGTLVLHLNLDGVRWFKTFLPPMELIENHGRIAKAIHNKITDNLLQSRELERLRGWLLPLLMNGQARVA